MQTNPIQNIDPASVKKNAGFVITLGVLTIILGMLAIGSPFFAGTLWAVWVGAGILIGGIFQLIGSIKAKAIWGILWGVLSIVAGGYFLTRPLLGLAVVTLFFAIYLFVEGITKIVLSFQIKPDAGWGWILFSGIITLALGIMIWRHWPSSAVWVIGTFVGINILFSGFALITLGSAARRISSAA